MMIVYKQMIFNTDTAYMENVTSNKEANNLV